MLSYLVVKGILVQELHWLQVRVELFYDCELLFQEIFDNVSHRYIVRQSDPVADGDKFSSTETKRKYPKFIICTYVNREYVLHKGFECIHYTKN